MKETASLTGKEFAKKIRDGDLSGLSDLQIRGDVDLVGVTVEAPLNLKNAVFTGELNFNQARFKRGVSLRRCRVAKKLVLSDAHVEGPLTLRNVTIYRAGQVVEKAAEFDHLHVDGSVTITDVQVHGDFSCDHADLEGGLGLSNVLISGNLSLRNATLGELRNDPDIRAGPRRCRIDGDLDLDSAKIAGDVFFEGIGIGGQLRLQAAEIGGNFVCRAGAGNRARTIIGNRAWLLAARVGGNLDLSGIRVRGDLMLALVAVGGNLQCISFHNRRSEIDGDVNASNVRVAANFLWDDSRIKGNFSASGARIEHDFSLRRADIGKELSLWSAAIKGDLDCSGARIQETAQLQSTSVGGSILLRTMSDAEGNFRCKIGKKVWLLGAEVTGDVDISGVFIGDDLMMQGAKVHQNLLASNYGSFQSEVKGISYLAGAQIDGNVDFLGVNLHRELDISNATIGGKFQVTFDFNLDEGSWKLIRPVIHGRIHARSVSVGKSIYLLGVSVVTSRGKREAERLRDGLNFESAHINGQFALYDHGDFIDEMLVSKQAEYEGQSINEQTARDIRNRSLAESSVIHGNVHLTGAQVRGGVILDGANIHGRLDMRDATVKNKLTCKELAVAGHRERASAQQVDLEALDMTGDIDLTGLDITGVGANRECSDLILRDSRVRGRLELCPFQESENVRIEEPLVPIAHIEGALNLDAAEISHIVISGHTFSKGAHMEEPKPGPLTAAWRWAKPLFSGGTDENEKAIRFSLERAKIGRLQIVEPLPGTLDLSNLRVDRWSLPDDQTSYEKMLRNSFPFKRSNYLLVENTLRNEGLDERADGVNVAMRRRDRLSSKSRWQIWFDSFLDLTVRYGTTSRRVACVMVALFVISVWVFSNPGHVEYKIAPASQKPPPIEHPAPASWGLPESSLFALRLNVPIVSLGIEEKVQPSGFALKAFAIAVVAASWVMWPLLLASMSGFIRRRG